MARPGSKQSRLAVHVPGPKLPLQPRAPAPYSLVLSEYLQQTSAAYRKRNGQFFTPEPLAQLMCAWVARNGPSRVLDPAVGLGIFPSVLQGIRPESTITALDADPAVLNFARSVQGLERVRLSAHDFLTFDPDAVWDSIVANPPYLRHHDFSYTQNIFQVIGERLGFRIPETTNLYALFMYEIVRRLAVGGRAAVLVPSDWLSANFGRTLKQYLIEQGVLRALVQFAPEAGFFEGVLTTSCVVLLERAGAVSPPEALKSVRMVSVPQKAAPMQILDALEDDCTPFTSVAITPMGTRCPSAPEPVALLAQNIPLEILRAARKWEVFFRAPETLPRARPGAGSSFKTAGSLVRGDTPATTTGHLAPLRTLALTRRGIATGANAFFLMSRQRRDDLCIRHESCVPCVGKAGHVTGLRFTWDDFKALSDVLQPVYLLAIGGVPSKAEQDYLTQGEEAGLPARYLLSVRAPWFRMENREPAPIWLSVQGRRGLRFIRNEAGVRNLTAFHGVYPRDTRPVYLDALTVCLNSRAVQKALLDESRIYAGGLIKIQPDDVLDVGIPQLASVSESALKALAGLLPELDRAWRTGQCLPAHLLDAVDACLAGLGPLPNPVAG